jgi:hypothetical protein
MPPAQALFLLPLTVDDSAALRDHCQALGLPAPIVWSHTDLPHTLADLIARPPVAAPDDPAANQTATGLPQPLVLCANLPGATVRALQLRYRAAGQRPLLAVVTPHSRQFTLATLLEHLRHDRRREEAARPPPPAP